MKIARPLDDVRYRKMSAGSRLHIHEIRASGCEPCCPSRGAANDRTPPGTCSAIEAT